MIHLNDRYNVTKNKFYIGLSGGVDSMAAFDFLRKGKKNVEPIFIDHGTENSKKARKFLHDHFIKLNIPCYRRQIQRINKPKYKSWEEHWRDERHSIFKQLDAPVITAHHLNDSIETYIWGMCHGRTVVPLHFNGFVYRPFLLTKKEEFISWCKRKNVPWIEDESNKDTKYSRNRIRQNILPEILKINPGIHRIVERLIVDSVVK